MAKYAELFESIYLSLLSDSISDHFLDTDQEQIRYANLLARIAEVHAKKIIEETKRKQK